MYKYFRWSMQTCRYLRVIGCPKENCIFAGNYCQPKCAEPWIEVKFENEKQGKVQVVASSLICLTNKPNANIEDLGEHEKVIASLGPFVTGNSYDSDELLETSLTKNWRSNVL